MTGFNRKIFFTEMEDFYFFTSKINRKATGDIFVSDIIFQMLLKNNTAPNHIIKCNCQNSTPKIFFGPL